MAKIYPLTKDQLDFISFIKAAAASQPSGKLLTRVNACLKKAEKSGSPDLDKQSLEDIRRSHNPALTADILSLFSSPGGFKFLTHDLDPDSDTTFDVIINQAIGVLYEERFKYIDGRLRKLLRGFIEGPEWIDYMTSKHIFHLQSPKMKAWTKRNPHLHPISSNKYREEIETFRKTIRVVKPNLASLIAMAVDNNTALQKLSITTDRLDKADFYTNVLVLAHYILLPILKDIAQREPAAQVRISFDRSTWEEYRLCSIRITHIGSEACPFDEVRGKFGNNGGAMFNVLKSCRNYCDWTIEADFEGDSKRWRILNFRKLPEIETLADMPAIGFTHIFTFYKKS